MCPIFFHTDGQKSQHHFLFNSFFCSYILVHYLPYFHVCMGLSEVWSGSLAHVLCLFLSTTVVNGVCKVLNLVRQIFLYLLYSFPSTRLLFSVHYIYIYILVSVFQLLGKTFSYASIFIFCAFSKCILLIMLLQLSHFFSLLFPSALYPPPTSIPPP